MAKSQTIWKPFADRLRDSGIHIKSQWSVPYQFDFMNCSGPISLDSQQKGCDPQQKDKGLRNKSKSTTG